MKKTKKQAQKIRKVLLKTSLSPGDLIMLTAAIMDLKTAHSDILVDVRTAVPDIWDNNVFIFISRSIFNI